MSTKNKRSSLSKIIGESLATGALVFLPAVTAVASPSTEVSTGAARVQTVEFKWPWENDDDDRVEDDYGEDDYDGDDGRYDSDATRQTIYGEVTRTLRRNEFEVRVTRGQMVDEIVTVRTRGNQTGSLFNGVMVQLRGRFDNFQRDVFIADDVDIVRDGDIFDEDDNGDARDVNFPGTVLRVPSRTRLTVRGDNGRNYTVSSRSRFSASIKQGDRVRIIGNANGTSVAATRVVLLQDGGGSIPGVPDYDNGGNFSQPVNFAATVVSVSGDRLTVRGDNGQRYFVSARNGLTSTIDRNDRVRIIGRADGQLVLATQVTLLDGTDEGTPDYGTPSTGQTMSFTGTIRTVLAGLLTVRSDNGQTYTVRYRGATSLRRGERVRVNGTFRRGVVDATSVRRF